MPVPPSLSNSQNGATHPPQPAEEEEEEDYMSMSITEPPKPKEKETYTQRRIRKQREAEASQPLPLSERNRAVAAARDTALSTSLPETSKGFKLLSSLGYKPGQTLGSSNNPSARLEPITLEIKDDRGGIGHDSEKKRKVREEMEREGKRVMVEMESEGDFRERVGRERERERVERLVVGAQRVCEGIEGEGGEEEGRKLKSGEGEDESEGGLLGGLRREVVQREGLVPEGGEDGEGVIKRGRKRGKKKPTREINVLWRGLVRERDQKERERRMKHDLLQSLSKNASYEDAEDERQEKQAFGAEEEEVEEGDEELEEFNKLEPQERLAKIVEYLREKYWYCLWCKFQYESEEMEGCPGLTEEDHD